jgi:hypothetical protein
MPTLAELVRAKHPGAYDDLPDAELEKSVLAKYPQYADLATPAPTGGILGGIKDLGIGALKGLGETVTSGTALAPLINKMAVSKFGSRAALPEDNAADKFLSDTLTSSNKTQMVGKGLEIGAELLGPGAFSKIQKFMAGRKAAPITTNALKELPLHEQMKHIPTQGKGPIRAGSRVGSPVQETTSFQDLPLYKQMDAVPVRGSGPQPGPLRTQAPPVKAPPTVPAVRQGAPVTPKAKIGKLPNRALSVGEEAGIRELDDLQRAIHGDDVKSVGNGLYKVKESTNTIAATKGPDAAAQTIEEAVRILTEGGTPATKVKLDVGQLGRVMRDRYGSQRGGDMLYGKSLKRADRKAALQKLAPGESKMPQIVKEAITETGGIAKKDNPGYATTLQRYASEGGEVDPKLLGSLAGAGVGAAVGATQGEDTGERLQNAAIGAAGGALLVPLLGHSVALTVPKKVQQYMFASVLSSPTTVVKAYSGAVGGAIGAALEKIAAGDVANGGAILRALFSGESAKTFVGAIKKKQTAAMSGFGEDAPNAVGRIYGAADAMARRAMQAGGISPEEAARYTLSGTPTTQVGQDLLGLFSRHFELKLVGSMFPRVGIQLLERGIERSPAGLLKGVNEGVSAGTRAARVGMGTGAGLAAYQGAEDVPDWAKPYLVALSGVYALPVAAGMAVSTAQQKGTDPLTAGLGEIGRTLPFPQYGPGEALKQTATGAALVPNVLRDVAEARDPHQRKTDTASGGFFARTKAKIPGLRETLPVKGAQTNIAGQPNEDRSSAAKRFISRPKPEGDKFKDVPADVSSELKRLDVSINQPAFSDAQKVKVGAKELAVPADLAEKRRAESRQFVIPRVQKLMQTAAYKRATDDRKKQLMQRVVARAIQDGNAKARTNVVKMLRSR